MIERARRYAFPAGLVVAGLILAIAAEHVTVLRAMVELMDRHAHGLLAVTLGAASLGALLFMGGVLHLLQTSGTPMTRGQVEAQHARALGGGSYAAGRTGYRIFGQTAGRQAHGEVSFAQFKEAWRRRRWRHDVRWRCIFAIVVGGMLLVVGGFSAAAVATRSVVRFMLLFVLVYGGIRTAWGMWRA